MSPSQRNPFHHPYVRLAVAGILLASSSCPAQTFTVFGRGCPGSHGIPALHNNGLPALGYPMQIDLTQAEPASYAVLLLAAQRLAMPIDLAFLGAPGCLLYMLPDINLGVLTDASGTAAVTFGVPNDPGLAGAAVHSQWVDVSLASLRITTSNGGTAVLGAQGPPISGGSVNAPASGGVGTVFTVRVRDLGTGDPDNLCMRLMTPGLPGLSLLRVTNITRDTGTGEDVITAQLATVGRHAIPGQVHLGLMRGDGTPAAASGSACLNTPVAAWAWQGAGLPGNDHMLPIAFVPTPSANQQAVPWVYDSSSNSLYVDIPAYPYGNGGLYPPNSGVTTDIHGDIQCGGGVPSGHFDDFLDTATVKSGCNLSAQTLATEHAPQVQQAFDNVFGVGRLTITAETTGSLARIRVKATNPSCTLTGGGGSLVITQ